MQQMHSGVLDKIDVLDMINMKFMRCKLKGPWSKDKKLVYGYVRFSCDGIEADKIPLLYDGS